MNQNVLANLCVSISSISHLNLFYLLILIITKKNFSKKEQGVFSWLCLTTVAAFFCLIENISYRVKILQFFFRENVLKSSFKTLLLLNHRSLYFSIARAIIIATFETKIYEFIMSSMTIYMTIYHIYFFTYNFTCLRMLHRERVFSNLKYNPDLRNLKPF